MTKKINYLILCFLIISSQIHTLSAQQILAGFRSCRLTGSYPGAAFPSVDYWTNTGKSIAAKFDSATPASAWIVGLYQTDGFTCSLNFPNTSGLKPKCIQFHSVDQNEAYLNRFDQEGFQIWLQVESGEANIDTLIQIVMNQYKHHPCVKGFGIDVEWFKQDLNVNGIPISDSLAQHWENTLKSIDSSYTLFLKHYDANWMPPTYRGDILFVNDSQIFTSLNEMLTYFIPWGNKFSANKVAFQFGYVDDQPWWCAYPDPMKYQGDMIRKAIPNTAALFWVDFTINSIFPIKPNKYYTATDSGVPSKNLIPFTHWVASADTYGSSVDTSTSIIQNENIKAILKQKAQWAKLTGTFQFKFTDITHIEITYKSTYALKIKLYQTPLSSDESYYCMIPKSTSFKTIVLHVGDFIQPSSAKHLDSLKLNIINSIIITPVVSSTTTIEISSLKLWGYQGTEDIYNTTKLSKDIDIKNYNSLTDELLIETNTSGKSEIVVYSINGQQLMSDNYSLIAGNNTIKLKMQSDQNQAAFIYVTKDGYTTIKKVILLH